jgi:outer membrane protein OmpA-like peptidoglycan-associated protein
MRKFIFSAVILTAFLNANAQFSIAVVGGPQSNGTTPSFTTRPDSSSEMTLTRHTGLNFGFVGIVPLNKKQSVFFRTGAMYSARGSQVFQSFDTTSVDLTKGDHYLDGTTILKVNYIDIPANLLLKFPMKGKTKFLLGGGVQASIFYNGSTDFSGTSLSKRTQASDVEAKYQQTINKDLPVGNVDDKFRIRYFSANALTGFEFGRVFITVNYSNGLTEFFKSGDQSYKHKTLGFHLGIFMGNPKAKTETPDTDGDGIDDDQDECPELAGTLITKGCPDKDGDGIPDKEDKCPDVTGTLKNNGCPVIIDIDGDSVNDNEDKCPDQAGPAENKGCPYLDGDSDGVLDKDDKCPGVPGTKKYNGCPVPDTDNDGVNDEEDKCPTVAGDKENGGCPKVTKEVQQKVSYAAKRIQFEFRSVSLSPSSFPVLDEVVDILKKNPTLNIRVEGHTSGPVKESNTILSQKRADSVKEYFISKGITSDRILSQGLGSSRHISKDGDTKENPEDRRVELIIF